MIYLSLNKNLYKPILEPNIDINFTSAIVCWIIIVIAIQLLVLSRQGLTDNGALLYGAFLGFAMYGVYNSTNFAKPPIRKTVWQILMKLNFYMKKYYRYMDTLIIHLDIQIYKVYYII
jgi:uncharacterized membrane protein